MDLRSGRPFWPQHDGLPSRYVPLRAQETCDVAIVGGGITGALTAFLLADCGMDAVLLEKRDIGGGSTAASTSLLQYEVDTHLHELTQRIGEEHAVRCYRLGWGAIATIEDLVRRVDDPCGFERKPSLYFASLESDVPRLEAEYKARKRCGFEVDYLGPGDVAANFSFTAPAAILSQGDAQVDAYRLSRRLIEAATRHGLRVYDRTRVIHWEQSSDRQRLETSRGGRVVARRVIFATGYETQQYLRQNVGNLNSTFALASQPLKTFTGWKDRCLIWETARPYFYLRSTPDGRALVGGEDHPWSNAHNQRRLLDGRVHRLVRRFQQMFPDIELEVASAWAGVFGETKDGLAYIGQTPEYPQALFALGYGGNGITYGVIAATILCDLCRGRRNADAEIFRFNR